jgi:alkaline phosphatase D
MPAVDVPVRWELAEDESFRRGIRRGDTVADGRATPTRSTSTSASSRRPAGSSTASSWVTRSARSAAPALRPCGATAPTGCGSCSPAARTGSPASGRSGPTPRPRTPTWCCTWATTSTRARPGPGPPSCARTTGPRLITLDDYRNRYGLYKGDPALQGIHAACPWIVTWDDHEVENNYAGLMPQFPDEAPEFPARRAAGYQAWWGAPAGAPAAAHRSRPSPSTGPCDWGRWPGSTCSDGRQYRS